MAGNRPNLGRIQPGDVIDCPFGIHREVERVTVHGVHEYPTGDLSIRFRYTSNPHGIDWSGFIAHDEPGLRIVARGVAAVDSHLRSLLPSA